MVYLQLTKITDKLEHKNNSQWNTNLMSHVLCFTLCSTDYGMPCV